MNVENIDHSDFLKVIEIKMKKAEEKKKVEAEQQLLEKQDQKHQIKIAKPLRFILKRSPEELEKQNLTEVRQKQEDAVDASILERLLTLLVSTNALDNTASSRSNNLQKIPEAEQEIAKLLKKIKDKKKMEQLSKNIAQLKLA